MEQTYLEKLIAISAAQTALRSNSMFTKFQDVIYMTDRHGRIVQGVSWNRMPLIESYCFCRGNIVNPDGTSGYKYFALNGTPLEFLTGTKPIIDNMWVVQEFSGVMYLARIEFSSAKKNHLTVSHERKIEGYGYLDYNTVIIKENNTWMKYDFYDDYVCDTSFTGQHIIQTYSIQDMLRLGYYPGFIQDVCTARGEYPDIKMSEFMNVKKRRSDEYLQLIGILQASDASIEMLHVKTKLPMNLIFLIKTIIRDKALKDFD